MQSSYDVVSLAGVSGAVLPLPAPRIAVTVRPGTLEDLPFIDALQKKHTKQVGFLHRATLEGKIKLGHVLIAEGSTTESTEGTEKKWDGMDSNQLHPSVLSVSSVVK